MFLRKNKILLCAGSAAACANLLAPLFLILAARGIIKRPHDEFRVLVNDTAAMACKWDGQMPSPSRGVIKQAGTAVSL